MELTWDGQREHFFRGCAEDITVLFWKMHAFAWSTCHRMQHLPCLTRWSNPIDNQIHRCHQQRVPTSQEAQGQYGWPRKEPQTLPLTIHHSTTLFDKASASLLLLFPTRLTSKIRLGAFSTAVTCFKKCQALVIRVEH